LIPNFQSQGHNGSIKVVRASGEAGRGRGDKKEPDMNALEIRVVIDGSGNKGKVKDLKQLSGDRRQPVAAN
jgi:hypothetical protein